MFVRSRQRVAEHAERDAIAHAFRLACYGAGCTVAVDGPIAGTAFISPELTSISLGPPLQLTARMPYGLIPADLSRVARQVAPHLGGVALRVVDRGHGWALVTVLDVDPLAGTVPPVPSVASALDPLVLGRGEDGRSLTLELATAVHVIVQGASGSGKSTGCYSLLGQLAAACNIAVTGSDITSLLLGPWDGRCPIRPALGTRDPAAHVGVLEQLVSEMDRRIGLIPAGRDAVDLAEVPILLAVIEETPGLLRLLDATDPKLAGRARLALARLLGEGRKAGVRLLIITQRADAKLVGAYERGQASHRLSFRVDSIDGARMLHPDITPDAAAEHATAPPGVALLSAPGLPLTRVRAPYLPYPAYCAALRAGRSGAAA